MRYLNSNFLPSTIRDDEGVEGAIFVDSIIIRENILDYPNDKYPHQKISSNEIQDDEFLKSLNGLLVFDEHPPEFVESKNYNRLANNSIGTIVKSEYKEINGDKLILSTLRIANPEAIKKIKRKEIKGGSLGYICDTILQDGVEQVNLKPNHFCITQFPRDSGVVILNSKSNKGESMTQDEVKSLIIETLKANNDCIEISKKTINSFLQTIESQIKDIAIKEKMNSKSEIEKIHFLDTILSINDKVFNSDNVDEYKAKIEAMEADIKADKDMIAEYASKIEALEKENAELKEANNSKDDGVEEAEVKKDDEPEKESDIKKENNVKQTSQDVGQIHGLSQVQNSNVIIDLSALDNIF